VLAAAHGWVAALLPLFHEALLRYSCAGSDQTGWECRVELEPLSFDQRALFDNLQPNLAGVWHSRLTAGPGPGSQESGIVKQVLETLERSPPQYRFLDGKSHE
jgi:hypothetical protein